MTINLTKGQRATLSKDSTGIIQIGLGWNASTTGPSIDLDAVAFVCKDVGGDPKAISDKYFIYYGNLRAPDGSVVHSGDNLTGDGDGDDETITVDLAKLPAECTEVAFFAAIYDAASKGQNFGMVRNCYIRAFGSGVTEEVKYDLAEDFSDATLVQFGSIYKAASGEWKFKAVAAPFQAGLADALPIYGLSA